MSSFLTSPSPCIIPGTRYSCPHSPVLDSHGIHLRMGCGKNGFRHRTHDSIIHAIATLSRSFDAMTKKEEFRCCFLEEADPESGKRPNLSSESFPGKHRKLVADFRVTCPYPAVSRSVLSVTAAGHERRVVQ